MILVLAFGLAAAASAGAVLPPEFNPDANFTISGIAAGSDRMHIELEFTHLIPVDVLRRNLKFVPPAPINWSETKMDPRLRRVSLRGEFKPGVRYMAVLPDGLIVDNRTYLRSAMDIVFPDMPPSVAFVEPKTVVERDSRQMIHVQAANIPALVFEGLKLPPLLIPMGLSIVNGSSAWDETVNLMDKAAAAVREKVGGDKKWRPFMGTVEREKQIFYTAAERNTVKPYSLPLTFRKAKESGALMLARLWDSGKGTAIAAPPRLFRITDLAISVKKSRRNLLVWVTSLKKAQPLKGVSLCAFTSAMEAFPLGKTDGDGIALIGSREMTGVLLKSPTEPALVTRVLQPDEIAFIVAAVEDDVSYLELAAGGNVKPEGIDQAQADAAEFRVMQGYLMTDRGVYRPDETVHIKGWAREYKDGKVVSPREVKLSFEVKDARGESVLTSASEPSEFGAAAVDLPIKPHFPRGTYTATMRYGTGKRHLTSRTFQVQDYKPPRHYAEIAFRRREREDTDYVNLKRSEALLSILVSGNYYAGGPVKHGRARWKIFHAGNEQSVEGFEGYTFGYPKTNGRELLESGEVMLDEQGQMTIEFPLDKEVLSGKFALDVSATVVDFDGRAAGFEKRFAVQPDYLVGIARHAAQVREEEPQVLGAVVLDKEGRKVGRGALDAEILQEHGTYIRKRNERGDLYWEYQRVWKRVFNGKVELDDGLAGLTFSFGWGGRYLVTFTYRDDEGRPYSAASVFDVAWDYWWDEPERHERGYEGLALTAEKTVYRPGEEARIFMNSRRAASWYLLTMERDGVLWHRVMASGQADKGVALKLRPEHSPNVYVSALGVSPRGDFPIYEGRYDDEAPSYCFGTINLPVLLGVDPLTVAISRDAPKIKAEPGAAVSLDLVVTGGDGVGVSAELAVGVVDESVLALTGWATPNLNDLARFDAPLSVFSSESRADLLLQSPYDKVRLDKLSGGDGLSADAEALASRARKRFNPVAYFNPAVRTGADGKATVTFTLPDTMTTYRAYAVACDRAGRFGHQQKPVLAVKDFYLEPGLPRFFNRGDAFTFLVTAFNQSETGGVMEFSLKASPHLDLSAPAKAFSLKAKDSTSIPISGTAKAPGAEASLLVAAAMAGKEDAVSLKIPVRGGHVIGGENMFGSFSGTAEAAMTLPEEARRTQWTPELSGEAACRITVAGSPFLRLAPGLKYLLDYPYGCVEQTSSGVLALAALRSVIKDKLLPGFTLAEADKFLASGIGRLAAMQTESGGFAYWPGYDHEHPWGTVYAGAALALAREAGAEVPADIAARTDKRLKAIVLDTGQRETAFRAFAVFILALDNALEKSALDVVMREWERQSFEGRCLTLLAARKSGLMPLPEAQRRAREVLGGSWTENRSDEFYARYRGPALALLLGQSVLPGDALTVRSAERLIGGFGGSGRWTSTSDTGWSLYALGQYFAGSSFAQGPVTVNIDQGGLRQSFTMDAASYRTVALDAAAFLADPKVNLSADASSTLLYRIELSMPRLDYDEKGHEAGFRVWKSIENMDGGGVIRVGDVVKVSVFVNASAGDGRYMILDDPLPAGLVAINSALATEEPPPGPRERREEEYWDWTPQGYYLLRPNFLELRDERVLAFRDWIWKGAYRFDYYARAVCQGEFVIPSTKVELMYAPEVNGYSPRGKLIIEARP